MTDVPAKMSKGFAASFRAERRGTSPAFRISAACDPRAKWRSDRQDEPQRFNGDLHRFAELWSIWFLLLIIATSVWYVVERRCQVISANAFDSWPRLTIKRDKDASKAAAAARISSAADHPNYASSSGWQRTWLLLRQLGE